MWAPGRIPAGLTLIQMMSHMDVWPTTAAMAGAQALAVDVDPGVTRRVWRLSRDIGTVVDAVEIDGLAVVVLPLARGRLGEAWLRIALKAVYTAKDTWLGQQQSLGGLPALYNLTMDPFEKYDMFFNGGPAAPNSAHRSRKSRLRVTAPATPTDVAVALTAVVAMRRFRRSKKGPLKTGFEKLCRFAAGAKGQSPGPHIRSRRRGDTRRGSFAAGRDPTRTLT